MFGQTYLRPGPVGPPGAKGDPGVITEARQDGGLEITPTDPEQAPAPESALPVAIPAPPAEGVFMLAAVDGLLQWAPVIDPEEETP